MKRRDFLVAGGVAGTSVLFNSVLQGQTAPAKRQFKLKYGPHFGMFEQSAGKDLVDQLKFAADNGFTAWEDNDLKGRSVDDQNRVSKAMDELGITMGVFVGSTIDWSKPSLTTGDQSIREQFLADIRSSVEVAKLMRAQWMTIVPGKVDNRQQAGYQTAHVVESLRQASAILEPHGIVMVLEALNWWTNHPGLFLQTIPQAYEICRAVNSPSCKILFDMYHQQISEGNLIPNIDKAWSEVAYFQIGDNPGRNEPGTGEINYRNVFAHIHAKGFSGVLGMEHGNSKPGKEGEQAVIDAYVAANDF